MDLTVLKSQQHTTWRSVAPGWKKHDARLTMLSRSVTERLIAHLQPGQQVLDIACGTGEPALPAAARVGPSGRVVATDFVEEMMDFAREKVEARGLSNVEFRRMDGESLDVPRASFDAVTMRWGLMFMPDPQACLTRVHAALKPGGTLTLSCWCGPERNLWASMPLAVIKRHAEVPTPPPGAPGLFAFADRSRLEQTLRTAGFRDVVIEEHELMMADFDNGAAYFDFTLELAGPIAMLFAALPAEKKTMVRKQIEQEAEALSQTTPRGKVRLGGTTWIAWAHV